MREYMDKVIELVDLSQNRPLNELVYEGLRKAILQGVIPVGEHINEKVYADYMNISRTPMRKAIEKLKEEDIIEYIPNFGVVVKRVTVEDAKEIYKIRIALETLATTTAMDTMTEKDFEAMRALLDETRMLNEEHRVKEVIQRFSSFNDMIFEMAKMPRLKIVIGQLQDYLSRFRDISLYDDARRTEALVEHEYIFECLKNKNEEVIQDFIYEHLMKSQTFVIEEIIRVEEELQKSIKV